MSKTSSRCVWADGGQALGEVLGMIRGCGGPAADKRRLSARAVAAELEFRRRPAAAVSAAPVVSEGGSITLLEVSLCAVGRLAGWSPEQRVHITEAKAYLRSSYGAAGGSMASRISRLSKGRNVAAHPDVGLPSAIACLASDFEVATSGAESDGGSGFGSSSVAGTAVAPPHLMAVRSVSQAAKVVEGALRTLQEEMTLLRAEVVGLRHASVQKDEIVQEEMAMLRADLAGLRHVSFQKEELVSMQEEIIMLRAEVSDLKHLLQLPKVLENVNEADTPAGAAGAGGKYVVQAVVATSSFGGQAAAVTNILVEGLSVPPVAAGLAFPILQMPKVLEEVNEAAKPTGAAGAGGKKVVQAVVATSSIGGQAVAATNISGEGLSVPPVAAGLAFKANAEAAPTPLAVNKVQPVAKQQVFDTAKLATAAIAKRNPKFKAKLKALLELSAKAKVVKEVMWIFGDLYDASDDDEGLLDTFEDLFKMVKLFATRGLGRSGDKLAALHECLGAIL